MENSFYIPAGIDERFPLGFSGKIKGIKKLSDDRFELQLGEAYLSDIVEKSKQSKISTKLNEENFLGVIAPSVVSASKQSKLQKISGKNIKSFLDGGVTFHSYENNRSEKSFLGNEESASITLGKIILNLEIDLPEVSSSYKAPGEQAKKEAKIVISGALSDLEIYDSHDYSLSPIDPYIEMDLAVKGKFNAEVKLEGVAEATLGNFSQVWKEVEKISFDKWGVKGKVSGIGADDKKGKLPIVGLVFKSPAPLFINQADLAVNSAKSGGFIVWLYLNAKGELSLKGATGIALHTDFKMGVNKPKDGKSEITKLIRPIEGQRMLEAPFIEGEAKLQFNLGLSLDVDVFFGGIRFVNTGLDFMGQNSLSLRTDGRASYGFDNLGEPWKLDGRMCIDGQLGAGMIFRANTKFGLEAESIFKNTNINAGYENQIPSQGNIDATREGWVDNLWYKFPAYKKCINNEVPIATEQSIVLSNISVKPLSLSATDGDNDSLKYTIKRPPTHGRISGTAPTLTYTPYIGYGGEDSFTFTVDDGMESSKEATISIWIITEKTDKDKDGIPDFWELQYPNKLDMDKDDSKEDSDEDGVSNYQEYLDDTNPISAFDFISFILEDPIANGNKITFKWNDRASAIRYMIYVSKEPINNQSFLNSDKIGAILPLSRTTKTSDTYTIGDKKMAFEVGVRYYAVVRAYSILKMIYQSNEKTFELKSVILAPASLQATSTYDSITLQWNEVLNVGAYKVCMSETPITDGATCEENGGNFLASANTKLIINQNLQDGKTYYFRVRGVGTGALWSDAVNIKFEGKNIPENAKEINLCANQTAYLENKYELGMTLNTQTITGSVFSKAEDFTGAAFCGEFAGTSSSTDVLSQLKNSFSDATNVVTKNKSDGSIKVQYEMIGENVQAYSLLKTILGEAGVLDFSNYVDYSTHSVISDVYIDLFIKYVNSNTIYVILAVTDKSVDNKDDLNTLVDDTSISDTQTVKQSKTDRFTYTSNSLKTDILFIMDDSGSMSGEQSSASKAIIDTFGTAMNSKGIDWKATVIGTGVGRSHSSKYLNTPVLNDINTLASQLKIGTNGSATEEGLENAYIYLKNEDIITRSNSKLSIVYISDEIEHTSLYELGVSDIKDSYFVKNNIKVNVIIPLTGYYEGSSGARDKDLAYKMANATGGEVANLRNYTTGYNAMMQKIADDSAGSASEIILSETPIVATINVVINGTVISSSNWNYNSANNSVVFVASASPSAGDKIELIYNY